MTSLLFSAVADHTDRNSSILELDDSLASLVSGGSGGCKVTLEIIDGQVQEPTLDPA